MVPRFVETLANEARQSLKMERASIPKPTLHEQIRRGSLTLTIDETKPMAATQQFQPQRADMPMGLKGKAYRSRYPLLVTLAALAWLTISLLGVTSGLRHAYLALGVRVQAAESQYQAIKTEHGIESTVQKCLGKVQSVTLLHRPFETHNSCLARAINTGHKQYLGLPYEKFTDVVNDTIEWAENTCGRLVFAPQTPMSTARTILHRSIHIVTENTALFYKWVKTVDIESAVQSMKSIRKWFKARVRRPSQISKIYHKSSKLLESLHKSGARSTTSIEKPECMRKESMRAELLKKGTIRAELMRKEIIRAELLRAEIATQEAKSLQLPPNYVLKCREDSVCRLAYTSPTPDRSTIVSATMTIDAMMSDIVRLRKYHKNMGKLFTWSNCFLLFVFVNEMKFTLFWVLIAATTGIAPTNDFYRDNKLKTRIEKLETRLAGLLTVQACAILFSMGWTVHWSQLNASFSHETAILALWASISGASMLAIFFVPCGEGQEGVSTLASAIKDLFNIWFLWKEPVAPEIKEDLASKVYSTSPTLSCTPWADRPSLIDDIQLARIIMHAEQQHASTSIPSTVAEWAGKAEDCVESSGESDSDSSWSVV